MLVYPWMICAAESLALDYSLAQGARVFPISSGERKRDPVNPLKLSHKLKDAPQGSDQMIK
jgi:hypothetical protein